MDKRHALAVSVPIIATGIPIYSTAEAADTAQTDNSDTTHNQPKVSGNDDRVKIPRLPQGTIPELRLFEGRDGEFIPLDPRLVNSAVNNVSNVESLLYTTNDTEETSTPVQNPLSSDRPSVARDTLVREPTAPETVARIADTVLSRVTENGSPDNPLLTQDVAETSSSRYVEPVKQTTDIQTQQIDMGNRTIIKNDGIEVSIPNGLKEPVQLVVSNGTITIQKTNIESTQIQEVNDSNPVIETISQPESIEKQPNTNELDALTERIREIAKPSGEGLYYMPNPTITNGKVEYLFDKNTCNSERRGYAEHIAATISIIDKYNELVSSDKYKQHKDTIIDVGDFMSFVHIEHDEDHPAIDLRSRFINSPSGTFDGPVFVPNSPNFDVDLTVELLEYAQSLTYQDKPVLKYVITADMKSLSEKTSHLQRYYINRPLMLFKNDHPSHFHFAFTLYDEIKDIANEPDVGEPCAITGSDFTEEYQVTAASGESLAASTDLELDTTTAMQSDVLHAMSSGAEEETEIQHEVIIIDDPELIEFMREEALSDATPSQDEALTDAQQENNSLHTISQSIPDKEPVDKSVVRLEAINPNSELARIINVASLTDGPRKTNEIIDDLSLHSQQLLNSIDAYAPVNPVTAATLRQENPGYTPYVQELQKIDRRLSEHEILARTKVAHEIVFGDRYGTEYQEDKIKSDVERLTAFSMRESQRYPAAVGDYKTESENSGSSGLVQILNWNVKIDTDTYEGIRDFDANLDPMQNLVHAYQMVDQNRRTGRAAFADWESGWKSDEGRRSDMEKYEENLAHIREEGFYAKLNSIGGRV